MAHPAGPAPSQACGNSVTCAATSMEAQGHRCGPQFEAQGRWELTLARALSPPPGDLVHAKEATWAWKPLPDPRPVPAPVPPGGGQGTRDSLY